MSKHYEAYEWDDDYYPSYVYNGRVIGAVPGSTATTTVPVYWDDDYYHYYYATPRTTATTTVPVYWDDDYYHYYYVTPQSTATTPTTTTSWTTATTPVTTSTTIPTTATSWTTTTTPVTTARTAVILDSDGFARQYADLSHRDVRGDDAYRNAIQGSDGDDVITGGSRDDVLAGGMGSDVISAGMGNDIVVGGGAFDTGINRIDGGFGDDILVGGGAKTNAFFALFVANPLLNAMVHSDAKLADVANIIDGPFAAVAPRVENHFIIHSGYGNDLILNFHPETDKIVVDRVLNGVTVDSASLLQRLVVNGSNAMIDLGQGNSITLVGVDAASLSAANFVVV